ncbi:hypothetical protein ACN2XU_09045 [Primorskyibacter sp. 2E107]|uniref:hypothetical protein n=1 Tax=Primorskyibacter sp. 2E107 TaxID=3403458 RepID=UPI003AF968BB
MTDYPPNKRGFLLKGAIVELKEGGLIGFTPSFHVFQYNPQVLNTTLGLSAYGDTLNARQAGARQKAEEAVYYFGGQAMAAQPDDPTLSFSLDIVIDAIDDLNESHPIGITVGIADRLAGLELLAYPNDTLVEQALSAVGDAIGDALGFRSTVDVPLQSIQLFVFGPGKVLPIRLTAMSIEEQAFHPNLLYPIRAKVSLAMQVLRPSDLRMYPETSLVRQIANGCYIFTREQKSALSTLGGAYRAVEGVIDIVGDIF